MNNNLRLKICEKFVTNRAFAEAIGMSDSMVGKIILGTKKPSESQKALIANLLRVKKDDLFPENAGDVKAEVVFIRKNNGTKIN